MQLGYISYGEMSIGFNYLLLKLVLEYLHKCIIMFEKIYCITVSFLCIYLNFISNKTLWEATSSFYLFYDFNASPWTHVMFAILSHICQCHLMICLLTNYSFAFQYLNLNFLAIVNVLMIYTSFNTQFLPFIQFHLNFFL